MSDASFAEAFASARIRKGQGPVRIRGELERRGVAAELIDAGLERAAVDWVDLVREVRERKYGKRRPTEFRERARQGRFLQYRGFTGEQIRAALSADGHDAADDD